MSESRPPPVSFSPRRRFAIGFNVLVSVVALGAVLVMANYLAGRHFKRFLWTRDARYQLSEQTRRVLGGVTNDIRITILFDRTEPLFDSVSGLLKEYAYACPHLTLEQVDYKRDLGRAETVITHYQLRSTEGDLVVFESEGRTKVVRAAELSDYNLAALFAGEKEVRRVAFRGEPRFTEAIAGLIAGRPVKACFLQGHREHDPASQDRTHGYAKFARLLEQKNLSVSPLLLSGTNPVPADCGLLIIAGPKDALTPAELEKVGDFLTQGGRLLALPSFYESNFRPTGLEKLLAGWGVAVGDNVVNDPNSETGRQFDLVVTNFGSHPIVRPLAGGKFYLLLARSVDPATASNPTADAPKVVPLFASGPAAFTASEIGADRLMRVDPRRDRQGIIPLAVAVEKGNLQGVGADRGSTRIVVVGESLFLGNETIEKATNFELASQAVDWLLDRPSSISGIAARPVEVHQITLTTAQLAQSRLILLAVLPGGVLAFGALVWLRRRS